MKIENKVFLRDEVVNIILTDKDCKDYVETIVSKILDINKENISLELITNRINTNTNVKYSYVDAIYEDKSFLLNIEVNLNNTNSFRVKNMRYICHLLLKNISPGELDKLKQKVYQINFNAFDIFHKNEFIYKSNIREETYNLLRDDFITIIDINLAYLSKLSYNEIIKKEKNSLEKLLYIFVCIDNKNLDKIYSKDKMMNKVRDKIMDLTKDFMDGLYYDHEEFMNRQAFELGEESGKKETQIEIVKNLLEDNKDISYISKITKLSVQEIEKIIKENYLN